jgi:hypothetical protein
MLGAPRRRWFAVGALVAFFIELPHRLIAAVMGFGSGVLIAVLSSI